MKQATVVKTADMGDYYNFFWVPQSAHSLHSFIEQGWHVKHTKDDEVNQRVFVLLERET